MGGSHQGMFVMQPYMTCNGVAGFHLDLLSTRVMSLILDSRSSTHMVVTGT